MLAVKIESPYEREGKMHVTCKIKNVAHDVKCKYLGVLDVKYYVDAFNTSLDQK